MFARTMPRAAPSWLSGARAHVLRAFCARPLALVVCVSGCSGAAGPTAAAGDAGVADGGTSNRTDASPGQGGTGGVTSRDAASGTGGGLDAAAGGGTTGGGSTGGAGGAAGGVVSNLDAGPAPGGSPPDGTNDAAAPAHDASRPIITGPDAATPGPDTAAPKLDASLPPANVQACAIVRCDPSFGDCCRFWFDFALDVGGKSRDVLLRSFTPTATAVTGGFAFERAEQEGVLALSLAEPRSLKGVKVTSSFTGVANKTFVTLESAGGAHGCGYALAATGEANLASPLFCWGAAFTPYQVAVHLVATGAGQATLSVTRVEVR